MKTKEETKEEKKRLEFRAACSMPRVVGSGGSFIPVVGLALMKSFDGALTERQGNANSTFATGKMKITSKNLSLFSFHI